MSTPAGWYDDGSGTGRLRYWDGAAWTEHTHEPTPSQAAPQVHEAQVYAAQQPTYAPPVDQDVGYGQPTSAQHAGARAAQPEHRPAPGDATAGYAVPGDATSGHAASGYAPTSTTPTGPAPSNAAAAPARGGPKPWVWGAISAAVVLVLAGIAAVAVLAWGGKSQEEKAIEETLTSFLYSTGTWDCAAMTPLMTEDFEEALFEGMSCDEVEAVFAGVFDDEQWETDFAAAEFDVVVTHLDDDSATATMTGSTDGETAVQTYGLVKVDGAWIVDSAGGVD